MWAQPIVNEHFQKFNLPKSPPKVMSSAGTCCSPLLNGWLFHALFSGNAFLENMHTPVNQFARVIVLPVHYSPAYGVRAQVKSQDSFHCIDVGISFFYNFGA